MWKLVAVYAPILGATLIGGALTIDEFHNWYDIVAGAIIGTVMAFSAYRMTYAAIWDWRYNHIPLHRGVPFSYGGADRDMELSDALWTRKAGWGSSSSRHGGLGRDRYGGYDDYGVSNGAGHFNRKPVGAGPAPAPATRGADMV
jgi:hypothetical protein